MDKYIVYVNKGNNSVWPINSRPTLEEANKVCAVYNEQAKSYGSIYKYFVSLNSEFSP